MPPDGRTDTMKRLITAVLALTLALCCMAASVSETMIIQGPESLPAKAAALTVSGSHYVARGREITLTASEAVKWKSSDQKIATVSKKGAVQGISPGKAEITATSRAHPKVSLVWEITVTPHSVHEITITAPASEIDLKETNTLALKASALPESAAQSFAWESSDRKVAKVSHKGVVTALTTGTVVITARATDGTHKKASVEITVRDSEHELPETLTVGTGKTSIPHDAYYGNQYLKNVIIAKTVRSVGRRAFASSSLCYIYIPVSVRKIDETAFDDCPNLVCLAKKTSYAGKWCEAHGIKRMDPDYITGFTPVKDSVTVRNGGQRKAAVRIEPTVSVAGLTWESSDPAIFTVDERGWIFGNYPGEADLTVSSEACGVTAKIHVKVTANYRALLFSESTFTDGVIQRNRGDVRLMKDMLSSVTGPDGGKYTFTSFDDLTAKEVYQKITELLVKPSRDGDVSMFFFASHGDYRSTDEKYAGRLWCKNKETWLELPTLAKELSKIRGKVIVLLESCGPGAALHDFDEEKGAGSAGEGETLPEEQEEAAFGSAVIGAFSGADPGLTVYGFSPDGGTAGGKTKRSHFKTEKFIVMTAAAYRQISYSIGSDTYNLFPVYLTKGVGTSGNLPADVLFGDSNGELTLHELYQYVYYYTRHKQTPQVYPVNSGYVLFLRK